MYCYCPTSSYLLYVMLSPSYPLETMQSNLTSPQTHLQTPIQTQISTPTKCKQKSTLRKAHSLPKPSSSDDQRPRSHQNQITRHLNPHITAQPPLLALRLLPPPTPVPIPASPPCSSACIICASLALLLRRLLPAPSAPISSCAIINSAHFLSSLRAAAKSPRSTRFVCSSTVGW